MLYQKKSLNKMSMLGGNNTDYKQQKSTIINNKNNINMKNLNNHNNNNNNNLITNNQTLNHTADLKIKNKCLNKACIDYAVQMEHSYSRDCRPIEGINGLTTRTLLVHKPPQCPSCHAHPLDESLDSDEANHPPIPPYNENAAKDAMDETTKIAQNVRNTNPDDEEWEERIPKIGWTLAQERLFSKIIRVLDLDNLSRLSTIGRQHEPVHRRVTIDRSVNRFRQIFASISWDSKLTQWLNSILMEYLPPTYMAIYLDILQTLKTKLPTLMDKMLFGKPMNINQELLTPVMKKQWEPIIPQKQRKLPSNSIILIAPSTSYISGGMSSRMQKWCQLFATMGQVVQVQIPNANSLNKQPIDQVCEQLVHLSRIKVQDIRREHPNSHITLVGFNAGAALALQVSLTENVNSIVCLGFAYNTVNGVRGTPDDQMLDITTPIIFVIGQNSARTSQEEMESLREKMHSETSLVVVGSADDVLRVPKNKRQIEGVTQSMVDSMVMDEIYEFVKNCIINPPGPRQVSTITTLPIQMALSQAKKVCVSGNSVYNTINPVGTNLTGNNLYIRKRKIGQGITDLDLPPQKMKYAKGTGLKTSKKPPKNQDPFQVKRKVGRPRTRPLPNSQSKSQNLIGQSSNEALDIAIQSILPPNDPSITALTGDKLQSSKLFNENDEEAQILNALELLTQSPKKEMKTSPIQLGTTAGIVTNLQQQQHQQPQQPRTAILTTAGGTTSAKTTQKIKMIPTNQFIHVKPPSQQNTQRIYTIKTSPMLGTASNQSQVFTVKTAGSQLTSSGNGNSPNTIVLNSPPKFTVYKAGANLLNTFSTTDSNNKLSSGSAKSATTDLSSTNILDLPILFADNDGNIHETAPISTTNPTVAPSSSSPIILNQQILSPASTIPSVSVSSSVTPSQQPTGLLSQSTSGKLILNTTASSIIQKSKQNKVVYINRNTMKPMNANIISAKNMPPLKYTKVVVTNPKTAAPSLVPKASSQQQLQLSDAEKGITTITIQKPSTISMLPAGNTSSSGVMKTVSNANVIGTSQSGQTGILTTSGSTKQFQPIIINVDSDKTTFKNMVKVGDGTQGKQAIVLKPGTFKSLPISSLKSGILNRNLTVRKVVNILQGKPNVSNSGISTVSQQIITPQSSLPTNNECTTIATEKTTVTTVAASSVENNDENQSNLTQELTLSTSLTASTEASSLSPSNNSQSITETQQNNNNNDNNEDEKLK